MLEGFAEWLTGTSLSGVFSDTTRMSTWLIVPVSQSVHILAVAIVMISVAILNLRLLGVGSARQNYAQLSAHLMPWVWFGLILLFITGVVQTIAEPSRELLNAGFRTKMIMVAITVAIMMVFEKNVRKDPHYWELSPERRRRAYLLAIVSLILWLGIAVAGRLVAYL